MLNNGSKLKGDNKNQFNLMMLCLIVDGMHVMKLNSVRLLLVF